MFSAIYIEEEIRDWDRGREIIESFNHVPKIICGRYGEVFNRTNQNFRVQKEAPALILAIHRDLKFLFLFFLSLNAY